MNYIKNNSKLSKVLLFIISISISLGLIISLCLDKQTINNIYNYYIEHINNYNTITPLIYCVVVIITILFLSLTIIGCFTPILAITIENISIGLLLGVLLRNGALKSFLFGIIYFIITKLLYLIIIIYLTINIYKFINKIISSIKNKNNDSIYNIYSKLLIRSFISIIIITVYNLIIMFFIRKLFNLFIFLL